MRKDAASPCAHALPGSVMISKVSGRSKSPGMGATRVVTSTSPHHMPENNRYVKQATRMGSMGPGEPTDSMGPGSYRIGIRVGAKDAQEAQVTPWGQGCQTSYLVHEARGMAAIKQWFVRFLQHRAASFHRISGAQAMPHAVKSLCCRV